MPAAAKTSSITVLESRISYFETGSGKSVFMLHGNPGTKNDFKAIADHLGKNGCRCISVDRPGHGNSEELLPNEPNPWLDAEAFSKIISKLFDGKAYIVGYSLGAFLALKLAIKFPAMVQGIGMIAPYVVPKDPNEKPSSVPGYANSAFLRTAMGMLLPSLASGKMRKHLQDVYQPATIPQSALEEDLHRFTNFEYLLATMSDKNAMLQIASEVYQKLPEIKCPVLTIGGVKDVICNQETQAEKICTGIPGSEKFLIEDGGHGLPFTHPKPASEKLLEHMKKTG